MRARYYKPIIGRFTQEDAYRGDGLNLYTYCRNNPVYYVDPTGHDSSAVNSYQDARGSGEEITPAQVAQSWQGSFPYVGVDKYRNITLKSGKIIYIGDPYPTGYATTKSAVDKINGDARRLFEGLQVKPYWEKGMNVAEYRSTMMAYEIIEPVDVAFGITKANTQFGSGGLPQMFIPEFNELLISGKIKRIESKAIVLNNYKMSLDDYNKILEELEGLK